MYPVLIEGPGLVLREVDSEDTAAILAATADPSALRHLPFKVMDDKAVADYLNELMDAAEEPERSIYPLAIVRRSDQQVMGLAQLTIESYLHRRAEIGYLLGPDYWGNGHGTEAVRLITEFGFDHLGLRRIFAIVATGNEASRRLLEAQSFHREGTMRDQLLLGERWVDGDLYARVSTASPAPTSAEAP